MLWLFVCVPLMVLAVAGAVLPLLLTILHDRRAEQTVKHARPAKRAQLRLAEAA